MLPVIIIGASSLRNAMEKYPAEFGPFRDCIYAKRGMSLNNLCEEKNVNEILKEVKQGEMNILLWHDVISNSISKHPFQGTEPLSLDELKEELRKTQWKGLVGFCYLPREDAQTNLDWEELSEFGFLKLRPILSKRYRDLFKNDIHLNPKLELHMVERVFFCEGLDNLMMYRQNMKKKRNGY